jgi:hypothetical protein
MQVLKKSGCSPDQENFSKMSRTAIFLCEQPEKIFSVAY